VTHPWLAITVEPSGDAQPVVDALFAAGSQGIQEHGSAIITHFPPGTSADEIERAVHNADPHATVTSELAPAADWSEWRASVREHRIGSLTIAPPWIASDDPMRVVIDPAMAFGTGEHATTRGVIRLMQQLPSMPARVADLGAGSAVLAICAARLGASRVTAIEIDFDAIGNAEENITANGVGEIVQVIQGDAAVLLPLITPVELVLANIVSSVLVELLSPIAESLSDGGHAILSGILTDERGMMMDALDRARWQAVAEDVEEGWWSVMVKPRP
jgi:ribosomal protein L11 methyltransferase